MKAMGISILFPLVVEVLYTFFGSSCKLSSTKILREVHVQLLQNL